MTAEEPPAVPPSERWAYADFDGMVDSWVVYADILGFTDRIKEAAARDQSDELVRELKGSLAEVIAELRRGGSSSFGDRFYEVRLFSDNLLLAFPAHEARHRRGEPEFGHILDTIQLYQLELACKGFFIRGGLAWGKLYVYDEIAVGPALIEAYKLDRTGGPPVIALSNGAIETVREHFGFYADHREAPQYEDLLEFGDDQTVFVNYLAQTYAHFPDFGVFLDAVKEHQTALHAAYAAAPSDSVRAKFEWLGAYHNFICTDFPDRYPPIPFEQAAYYPEQADAHQQAQEMRDYRVNFTTSDSSIHHVTHEPIRRDHC